MKNKTRSFISILAISALSACTFATALRQLDDMNPQGSDFNVALAHAYRDLANKEADSYDWIDGEHFAKKAMQSARNEKVEAEDPNMWSIKAKHLQELELAREQLVDMLSVYENSADAKKAAIAQVNYDCWVEQAEENDDDGMHNCKESFFSGLKEITGGMSRARQLSDLSVFEAIEEDSLFGEFDAASTQYMIFFELGAYDLDSEALVIAENIYKDFLDKKGEKNVIIKVGGHTDTSGNPDLNMQLSLKRAEAVKEDLIIRGVPSHKIKVSAFGQENLRVETPDNTPEKANRRVEVFLEI